MSTGLNQNVPNAPTIPNVAQAPTMGNMMSDLSKAGPQAPKPKTFVGRALNPFSNSKYLNSSKEFLESNSLIAKFAFLVLVLIGFVMLMRLGISILGYFMGPSRNPYMFKGMKDGKTALRIAQNPNTPNSIPVYRSTNQKDGLEFTWSFWIHIDDLVYKEGSYKHIFHKGNNQFTPEGLNEPNNAPGVYIDRATNNLIIIMNTFNNIMEKVEIEDIPLNKWILVNICVEGEVMDVFVNSSVAKRHRFNGVPKQNYGDVYVNYNGGFSGYLSNLRYHDYTLSVGEILSMSRSGPNMSMNQTKDQFPPYFSMRWYMQNAGGIGAV